MNSLNITGNMTGDAEIKNTSSGTLMATFTVAVNKGTGGEADFFRVNAYDAVAKRVGDGMKDGRFLRGCHVEVSGEMHQSSYTDKDGQNRISWSVTARYLKGSKKDFSGHPQSSAPQMTPPQAYENSTQPAQPGYPVPQYTGGYSSAPGPQMQQPQPQMQQPQPQMQQPQEYRPMQPSYPGYYNMATAKTVGGYMPAQNQIPMN